MFGEYHDRSVRRFHLLLQRPQQLLSLFPRFDGYHTANTYLLLTVILLPTVYAEVWRITSLNWQPYSGDDLPHRGSAITLLSKVLETEGIILEVEFYPWSRVIRLA